MGTVPVMSMSIFRRVVVPLEFEAEPDGGDAEPNAFLVAPQRWVRLSTESVEALRLAGRLSAEFVDLVHAVPDIASTAAYGGAEGMFIAAETIRSATEATRVAAIKILHRIGEATLPDHVVTGHAAPGGAAAVVVDVAKACRADAIVMAASARGRIHRAFVGSTVNRIVRTSPCPVIVVPVAP